MAIKSTVAEARIVMTPTGALLSLSVLLEADDPEARAVELPPRYAQSTRMLTEKQVAAVFDVIFANSEADVGDAANIVRPYVAAALDAVKAKR